MGQMQKGKSKKNEESKTMKRSRKTNKTEFCFGVNKERS